ncbi:MAG: hypothetical protein U0Q15_06085 [Kineosporiaceae bacterium]
MSLLLSTTPGPRLSRDDAANLLRLQTQALARLRSDPAYVPADLPRTVERLVDEAMDSATDRGLAVYASERIARIVHLPVGVEDRAVIDPTFATRDLVLALHRTPRHAVLVLGAHRAQLFDGATGRLSPARGGAFPLDLKLLGDPESPATMRAVDRALGAYLRLHPAPVVLAGPQRQLAAFRQVSKHLQRCAGHLYGVFDHARLPDLAARTRPVIEDYLHSREKEALALLDERTGQHRVAVGVAAAWLAARTERPEMLAVEESFRYPARLIRDGDLAVPAEDVEAPDVIDDLVDELIETVLSRGGWVALVRDGGLGDRERVAVTVRG